MKKAILLILCFACLTFSFAVLSGCDKSAKITALGISESEYNAGERIIEITDNYLDYKISKEEAKTQLNEIEERISETSGFVSLYCRSIVWKLLSQNSNDKDILKDRNDLANRLGISEKNTK